MSKKHSHYFKDVKHLSEVDVYRVLGLFNVTDQAIGHAIKKLLCAGQRGAKDLLKDYGEAIDSIQRAAEMIGEDGASNVFETRARLPWQDPVPVDAESMFSRQVTDLKQELASVTKQRDAARAVIGHIVYVPTKEGTLELTAKDVEKVLSASTARVSTNSLNETKVVIPRPRKAPVKTPVRRRKAR